MSGLKQLRNRIKSIKSTKKITKAMQVVSASKLRKVKDQAENFDEYSSVLRELMNDIRLNVGFMELSELEWRFFDNARADTAKLFIIMTSERGLCGSFNSQIIKAVKADIAACKEQNVKVRLLIIGKKGYDALKGAYQDLIEEYYHIHKENFLSVALQIREKITSLVEQNEISKCYLYYNQFKNALTQVMVRRQVLPVEQQAEQDKPTQKDANFEYEGQGLVRAVIDLYIIGVIKYGFLQSRASEEAARMTAMDNATRNASDLIDKLTLGLNRSRQAMITTELTEIIAGAEASVS